VIDLADTFRLIADEGVLELAGGSITAVQLDLSGGEISGFGDVHAATTGVSRVEANGGTVPGSQHDKLIVSGTAHLDGVVSVRTIDGYAGPPSGTSETITAVTANTVDGAFGDFTLNERHLGGGLFADPIYHPGQVDVELLKALPGDTAGDRDVDFTDLLRLVRNFDPLGQDQTRDWLAANFDGDSDVDIVDFNELVLNFAPLGYGSSGLVGDPAASLRESVEAFAIDARPERLDRDDSLSRGETIGGGDDSSSHPAVAAADIPRVRLASRGNDTVDPDSDEFLASNARRRSRHDELSVVDDISRIARICVSLGTFRTRNRFLIFSSLRRC